MSTVSGCPNCNAPWGHTELVAAASQGGGYRVRCHDCGHEWNDPNASHGARTDARKRPQSDAAMTEETTSGGFALLHDRLTVPPVHIPDGTGGAYKTELVIERTPERTEKVLWWHADDPRPEPHNHPWDFTSTILHGGYTEDRYTPQPDGSVYHTVHVYRADGSSPTEGPGRSHVNLVRRCAYHRVHDVLPGTVTRMVCGPAVPGNEWGYLDLDTGQLLPSTDPGFRDALEAINPHLRPRTSEYAVELGDDGEPRTVRWTGTDPAEAEVIYRTILEMVTRVGGKRDGDAVDLALTKDGVVVERYSREAG